MLTERPFTLALGGGGVKCFAHLGVLNAFESSGLPIEGIAATSAAAVIAALYASGRMPGEIRQIAVELDFKSLSKIRRADRRGLWGLSEWRKKFAALFGSRRIEDLSIPVAFPLVDLDSNREISVTSGPVAEAVTAAVAIPGIFPPQKLNEREVIDGGVLNPVPVGLARSLSPGAMTAAVALVPPVDEWDRHPFPRLVNTVPLFRFLGKLRYTQALGVYVQASDLTNRLLVEYRLRDERPDFVIRPEVNHLGLFDNADTDQIIAAGETAAIKTLTETNA